MSFPSPLLIDYWLGFFGLLRHKFQLVKSAASQLENSKNISHTAANVAIKAGNGQNVTCNIDLSYRVQNWIITTICDRFFKFCADNNIRSKTTTALSSWKTQYRERLDWRGDYKTIFMTEKCCSGCFFFSFFYSW